MADQEDPRGLEDVLAELPAMSDDADRLVSLYEGVEQIYSAAAQAIDGNQSIGVASTNA